MVDPKRCDGCAGVFPRTTEYFYACRDRSQQADGLQNWCITCVKAVCSGRKAFQGSGGERMWASRLAYVYGVTPEEYWRVYEFQGGVCAICGSPPGERKLHLDHDHDTFLVRGLLCPSCNGFFRRHRPEAVAAYLANPPAVAVLGERYARGRPALLSA